MAYGYTGLDVHSIRGRLGGSMQLEQEAPHNRGGAREREREGWTEGWRDEGTEGQRKREEVRQNYVL